MIEIEQSSTEYCEKYVDFFAKIAPLQGTEKLLYPYNNFVEWNPLVLFNSAESEITVAWFIQFPSRRYMALHGVTYFLGCHVEILLSEVVTGS
jgi:hypothetical protein